MDIYKKPITKHSQVIYLPLPQAYQQGLGFVHSNVTHLSPYHSLQPEISRIHHIYHPNLNITTPSLQKKVFFFMPKITNNSHPHIITIHSASIT